MKDRGSQRPEDASSSVGKSLRSFFAEIVRVSLAHPSRALFFAGTVLRQVKAARLRSRFARQGVPVPPIAIFSITNRCNLHCKGCYAQAIRGDAPDDLSAGDVRDIVAQAERLGIAFFVIAGGEPLTRPEILDITRDFRRVMFLLVTNGMLLDQGLIERLKRQPNTVPVLSVEGTRVETDERRGEGVHERLQSRIAELKAAGVFFALSLTMTRSNFDVVTDGRFVEAAIAAGCRLFFFLEYTPIHPGTDAWAITDVQRKAMKGLVAEWRRRLGAVFIAMPWDEAEQGGCMAAGRAFVHISPSGAVEPCPFAPYSDVNLRNIPLKEALQSRLLAAMRESHDLFKETDGGCALWRNQGQVQELLERVRAG